MEFAIQDTNGAGTPISNGKFEGFTSDHKDWKYDWGVRVGAGFYLDHDAWNIDLNWTYLKISNYRGANVTTGGGTLIPLWLLGEDGPASAFSNRTSAVWDGNYDTVDASLGKPYHVSRYLVLSPFFGLRGGWITQHFSVDYSGDLSSSTRMVHHGKNDFWGIGARTGLNSDWILGKGFCLFGNFATSLLYGKFEIEQHLATPGTNIGFDIDTDHYMNVPNFEIALGFAWGKYFNKNKYHVRLKAAYEFHYWWNQLNLRRFWGTGTVAGMYPNDVVARGDFSLSGFSLSLGFDI
jgi:hypothetical protein